MCSITTDRSYMESYTPEFYLSNYAFFRYLSIAKILGTLPNMSNVCFRWDDPSKLMMCKLINQNNHFREWSAVLDWKIINWKITIKNNLIFMQIIFIVFLFQRKSGHFMKFRRIPNWLVMGRSNWWWSDTAVLISKKNNYSKWSTWVSKLTYK